MAKKKINEKNKVVPRFTVLDAVIVLVVILAVLGIYFRQTIVDFFSGSDNLKEYAVSYSIKNIRYTTPDYINVGDELYFSSNGELLGTILNDSENMGALALNVASEYMTDSNGKIVKVSYPENTRVDATGRFLCLGKYYSDGGFLVNGSEYIAPGNVINVQTELVTFSITILEINEYNENMALSN